MSISLAPNDKAGLYVDRDQSVFDGDKRRMVLYTFNRFEKPDFNALKTLSRIEIEIDRKTEQAKIKVTIDDIEKDSCTVECLKKFEKLRISKL